MPVLQKTLPRRQGKEYSIFEAPYTYSGMPTYTPSKIAFDEACHLENSLVHPVYLHPDGKKVYRPLTIRENLQARVDDFWKLKAAEGKERSFYDRIQLFEERDLVSCTSIQYQEGTTKFAIIPLDHQLIRLPKNHDDTTNCIPSLGPLPEVWLDSSQGKYNQPLTPAEVLEHEGWLVAAEGDRALLREHSSIVFYLLQKDTASPQYKGMAFYVALSSPGQVKRVLLMKDLVSGCQVTDSSLYTHCSFIKLSPAQRNKELSR